jgi:hypothetical protein
MLEVKLGRTTSILSGSPLANTAGAGPEEPPGLFINGQIQLMNSTSSPPALGRVAIKSIQAFNFVKRPS